jgi:NADPH:quinone reductase-like Zn-dependent oxidoreductase
MRAYQLPEFGGPRSLRRVELPGPTPRHGEVLIRVRAVSLNYRDLLVARGQYNPKLKLPRIPASDAAGDVVALGGGTTRFQVGDKVVAAFMPAWVDGGLTTAAARSALGGDAEGVLAEEVAIPEAGLARIPDHLSFEEASTLPCAAVTGWSALIDQGGIKPGDTVLTQGTGGVSLFAIQFARMAGAQVVVTSSSDAKLARALALGAHEGINYKSDPNWDERARELTGGVGVDHIVELGGAGTLPRSFRAVRPSGTISLIGVLSGFGEVNPLPLLMRNLRLQGVFVGPRRVLDDVCKAVALHRMRPVIDRVFEFEQAAEALAHLESGTHFGKIVIKM